MKKILSLLMAVSCMLILIALPVSADFSASLDLTAGNAGSEYYNIGKMNESSSLNGFGLGLDYQYQAWLFGMNYASVSLNDKVGDNSSLTVGDYRVGYRFYENDGFSSTAILSYDNASSGSFSAGGWTAGLGAKYLINPVWTFEGRLGYSLFGGVSVKNHSTEYQSPSLFSFALKLNYLISDQWSVNAGYRRYAFSGNSNNQQLESNLNLFSVGAAYRFNVNNNVKPKSGEPELNSKPQPQPAPSPEPKTEPAPVQQPQPGSTQQSESIQEPEPAAEGNTLSATETPKPNNPVTPEQIEKVNQVLQPIFFAFDKYSIRSSQLPALQKDLEVLRANAEMFILIAGHADRSGKSDYNLKLSAKRADAVKQWLIKQGINPGRITVAAYGSKYPYKAKSKDSRWESDRWVDIFVTADPPTEETGIRR